MFVCDIEQILEQVEGELWVFQEVIDQGGEFICVLEYIDNGVVIEFNYLLVIGEVFSCGLLVLLYELVGMGQWLVFGDVVVFVDNYDNQCGYGGGGYVIIFEDGWLYDLVNVFMFVWFYGYFKVMLSYVFDGDIDVGLFGVNVYGDVKFVCFNNVW